MSHCICYLSITLSGRFLSMMPLFTTIQAREVLREERFLIISLEGVTPEPSKLLDRPLVGLKSVVPRKSTLEPVV